MKQLLEKTRAHHTFLFPKALCLHSGWLVTQPAGALPKASAEQRLSAEAGAVPAGGERPGPGPAFGHLTEKG